MATQVPNLKSKIDALTDTLNKISSCEPITPKTHKNFRDLALQAVNLSSEILLEVSRYIGKVGVNRGN